MIAWHKTGLLCIVLLLAACGQQAAPTPTLTPSIVPTTAIPSATPIVRATLPPTWTLAVSLTPSRTRTPTITFTPTITLTPSRTFTPSKTFTPTDTYTPTFTPSPNATNQFLLSQPLPAICAEFGADPVLNPSEFSFSTAPTIVWTPVETAAAYQVRLYDRDRATLHTQTTTETSLTFSAALFVPGQRYAWDVVPLDGDGVQICPGRGAVLTARP